MASISHRIKYYTKRPKKPILLYPNSVQWFNATTLEDLYLQWKYGDTDLQAQFEIEIASKAASFGTASTDLKRVSGTSSSQSIAFEDLVDDVSGLAIISQSGIYYWRVRVKGTTKSNWSGFSEIGQINVDTARPELKGLDVIVPVGWNVQKNMPAAEIHSNYVVKEGINKTGYFVGWTNFKAQNMIIRNYSGGLKTFYGTITLGKKIPYVSGSYIRLIANISTANIVAVTDQGTEITTDSGFLNGKKIGNGAYITAFKFLVTLPTNNEVTLRIRNDVSSQFTYDLHITAANLFNTSGWTEPNDSQQQKSSEVRKQIFIGGAETPPFAYDDYNFTLLLPQFNISLPLGKTHYLDNSENNTIAERTADTRSFITDMDLSNIKAGDVSIMQRSYDKFQRYPKHDNKVDQTGLFTNLRDSFEITSVNTGEDTISLGDGFNNLYVNVKYPAGSNEYGIITAPADPIAAPNFETGVDKVFYDDGTEKERTYTKIKIADAAFHQKILRPNSSSGIIKNELSNRWIGFRIADSGDDFKFYPIIFSDNDLITVVGEVDDSFYEEDLDYFITGDSFVITQDIFAHELSNAYLYIGTHDSVSGMKDYLVFKNNKHRIVRNTDANDPDSEELTDVLGNKFAYLDRVIPHAAFNAAQSSSYNWIPFEPLRQKFINTDVRYKCFIGNVLPAENTYSSRNDGNIYVVSINTQVEEIPGAVHQINNLIAIRHLAIGCYAKISGVPEGYKFQIIDIVYDRDFDTLPGYRAETLILKALDGADFDEVEVGANIIIDLNDIDPEKNALQGGFYSRYYASIIDPTANTFTGYRLLEYRNDKTMDFINSPWGANYTLAPDEMSGVISKYTGWCWIDESGLYEISKDSVTGINSGTVNELSLNGEYVIKGETTVASSVSLYEGWNLLHIEAKSENSSITSCKIGFSAKKLEGNSTQKFLTAEKNALVSFIPLNFKKTSTDQYFAHEIFVNVRDKADNLAVDTIRTMPSALIKSIDIDSTKYDKVTLSGTHWSNNRDKHPKSIFGVTDTFPITDNEGKNAYMVTAYPTSYNVWSPLFAEMHGSFFTWNKWPLGTKYQCKIEGSVTSPELDNDEFFVVKVDSSVAEEFVRAAEYDYLQVKNFNLCYRDIVGCKATFLPSHVKHNIVNVMAPTNSGNVDSVDDVDFVWLVLEGQKGDHVAAGSYVIIDTLESTPSETFTQNGLHVTYYNQELKSRAARIERNIDYLNRSLGSSVAINDFEENVAEDDTKTMGVVWKGYFWAEVDGTYKFFFKGRDVSVINLYLGERKIIDRFYNVSGQSSQALVFGSSIQEQSVIPLTLKRGWHQFFMEITTKEHKDNGVVGRIQASYRSTPDESIYYTINEEDGTLPRLPVVYEIGTDNSIVIKAPTLSGHEDFDAFRENELANKYALLNIINAKTGATLTSVDDSVNDFQEITAPTNGSSSVQIVTTSSDQYFNIDYTKSYFMQIVGDYNTYGLDLSKYNDVTETKVLYPTVATNQYENIIDANIKKYRIGRSALRIVSNTADKIHFVPAITGEWTGVSKLVGEDIVVLTDTSNNFVDNLKGYPMVLTDDTGTVYNIISSTAQTIQIKYTDSDYEAVFLGASFRIRDIRDIVSTTEGDNYLYIPLGQKKEPMPEANLIRNAAKMYVRTYDFYGNYLDSFNAISLKDVRGGGGIDISSGSIIDFNITDENYTSMLVGDVVYDCNETESVVGIYESRPIAAPTGFSYWTMITWEQHTPVGTSIEVSVRTAETESGLKNAVYNMDAFDKVVAAYTLNSWDTPKNAPEGVDISKYSTSGEKNSRGEIIKKRWLQFRVVLKSTITNLTPSVDKIRVTYASSEERVIFLKNMDLQSNITKGFLRGNVELPTGTSVVFGINTANETDFNRYQVIPVNEAFEIIEPRKQFRLAAKLISSGTNVPKIHELAFMWNTDDYSLEELPNIDL